MLKRPNFVQALFLSGFLFATAKVASIIFDDLLYFEVFIFVVVIIPVYPFLISSKALTKQKEIQYTFAPLLKQILT